jgi:hypothetical protein
MFGALFSLPRLNSAPGRLRARPVALSGQRALAWAGQAVRVCGLMLGPGPVDMEARPRVILRPWCDCDSWPF